jgi:hypothetical protein
MPHVDTYSEHMTTILAPDDIIPEMNAAISDHKPPILHEEVRQGKGFISSIFNWICSRFPPLCPIGSNSVIKDDSDTIRLSCDLDMPDYYTKIMHICA